MFQRFVFKNPTILFKDFNIYLLQGQWLLIVNFFSLSEILELYQTAVHWIVRPSKLLEYYHLQSYKKKIKQNYYIFISVYDCLVLICLSILTSHAHDLKNCLQNNLLIFCSLDHHKLKVSAHIHVESIIIRM